MTVRSWALVIVMLVAAPASASFHLWQIGEVYSNSSGTVQFIELFDGFDGEEFVAGQTLSSTGNNFMFPGNLPNSSTANKHMLIATPGYFALSGVPPADYNLGVNNFFSTSADTIDFAGVSSFAFSSGQLPTNGTSSLNRAYNSETITTALNSPTNFAGQTGSVPEPSAVGVMCVLLPILLRRRCRASAQCELETCCI